MHLKIVGIENIWVDTQDSIIGVIYNSPSGSQRDFIDEFENVLRSVFLSKRKCLILGDSSTSIHSSRAQQQKKTSTWSSQKVLILWFSKQLAFKRAFFNYYLAQY